MKPTFNRCRVTAAGGLELSAGVLVMLAIPDLIRFASLLVVLNQKNGTARLTGNATFKRGTELGIEELTPRIHQRVEVLKEPAPPKPPPKKEAAPPAGGGSKKGKADAKAAGPDAAGGTGGGGSGDGAPPPADPPPDDESKEGGGDDGAAANLKALGVG